MSAAQPGHFYAIGIGPGAPDLLTVRAARLIETAGLIIAPRSERAAASVARRAIAPYLNRQEVVERVYPMGRDAAKTRACWTEVARLIEARCAANQAVTQVTLGDPLLYSTSAYILEALNLPPERIHVVPGISAMQSAAALFGEPLTLQEDRLLIMPATDLAAVEAALDQCETLVLYKAGRHLSALHALLERKGLLPAARLVCNAEQEERQFLSRDLRAAANGNHGYLATVIVHLGHRAWATAGDKEQP